MDSSLERHRRRFAADPGDRRAFEALEEHEFLRGAWERLVDLYRHRLTAADLEADGSARARVLLRLGRVLEERCRRPDEALPCYEQAAALRPGHAGGMRRLRRLYTAREQWELALQVAEVEAAAPMPASERAELHADLGEIWSDALRDPSQALAHFERALEADASSTRAAAGRAAALADLGRAGEAGAAWRDLAGRSEGAERARARMALARLPEGPLEQSEDAAERYRNALAGESAESLDALAEALRRSPRVEELAAVLERRAALAVSDAALRGRLLAAAGDLYAGALDDSDAARDAYERSLAADPSQAQVRSALEELYTKAEQWSELRGLLERDADRARGGERARRLCRLADLHAERLGEDDRARTLYEEALELDAGSRHAVRRLRELARRSGDEEGLLRAAAREAELTGDAPLLARLVPKLVERLEARGDLREALRWLQRLRDAAPDPRAALEATARIHEALGERDELIATLARLDGQLSERARAANRRRIAALHDAEGRTREAADAWQAALESDPFDRESLEALLERLPGLGRPAELARVKRQAAELLPEPKRSEQLRELAALLADDLEDAPAAIEVLSRLCEETPDPDAEAQLEALLERSGRIEELARRLAERRDREPAGSPAARALDERRAELLLERLGRPEQAAVIYRGLADLDHAGTARRALHGLERALRAANDDAGLAEVLAERAQREPEPERRAALELERAALLEESPLDRPDEARAIYAALGEDPPVADEAASRLERLLARREDWPGLRSFLSARLGRGSRERDVELRERLARLALDRFDDPADAAAHLEAAVALEPERRERLETLASLYEGLERPRDLVRVLEGQLALPLDPQVELRLRARAAKLYRDELGDAGRAATHYARVRELDPGHAGAVEVLAERAERAGRHAELRDLLQDRLASLQSRGAPEDAERRTSLRVRLADLLAGPLDDPEGAVSLLEAAESEVGAKAGVAERLSVLYERLHRDPERLELCRRAAGASDSPAERAQWSRRLGNALCAAGHEEEAAAAYRRALADQPGDLEAEAALRDLHRRRGEAAPLARLLEMALARVAGGDEVELRFELGALLEGPLARPEEALLQLRRVLEIDPSHERALDHALAVAESLGRTGEMDELLALALERTRGAEARARILARRAALLAGPLGRAGEALSLYREALTLNPAQREVRRELRGALESLGRWEDVLELLHVEASCADPERRAAVLEEAADLAAKRVSPDAALPWLERLRAERPRDAAVLSRIAAMHRRAGRPAALLRAIEAELALGGEPARRRTLALERARLLAEDLGSPARAVRVLEAARREAPGEPAILRALERLYIEQGRTRERVEVLEELAGASSGRELVSIHRCVAGLAMDPLGEPDRAARHLRAALEAAPGTGLARVEILQALGEALRAAGRVGAWAEVAGQELASLDPGAPVFAERRRELHRALAWACDGPLEEPDRALAHFRAFVDGAGDEEARTEEWRGACDALLRLLRAEGSHVELARRLRQRLARDPEDPAAWIELARLREERLHQAAAAADAYREALRRRPESLDALRGLRRVSERTGDWPEVAAALQRELDLQPELPPREQAALLRRLGEIAAERLQSSTRASRAFAAALEADPRDLSSLRSLERLFETVEDWRGALDLYESEIEVLGDAEPDRRRSVWLRAGELARERTRQIERAVAAYEAARAIAPLSPARDAELAEMYRELGDMPHYVEAFARWCDAPEGGAAPGDHLRLARALEEIGRTEDALARVDRALRIDRHSRGAWDAAARLRQARGDASGAADARAREAELLADGEAGSALLRAAALVEERSPERSASLLCQAAERDPASPATQAALARVCGRLGRHEESLRAAERALDLASAGPSLAPALRVETAVRGADAARALGRLESAAQLYAEALSVDAVHRHALAAQGEVLFELGDLPTARRALEGRLALPDDNPARARHLLLSGIAAERCGEREPAVERYRAALAVDASLDEARAGLLRLYEEDGRTPEAVAVLEEWAARSREPAERARRLVRAAELELQRENRGEAAEALLREAATAAPAEPGTWQLLAHHLVSAGRSGAALEVTAEGIGCVKSPAARGGLSRIRARLLEEQGDRRAAAEAYGVAAGSGGGDADAALARARLLRALGEWGAAADTLAGYASRHPDTNPRVLARIQLQLGRLRAGPLEDIEGAIEAYRRALEGDPALRGAREALAELLVHVPARWDEALARHRELLDVEPWRDASLRAVLQIARGRRREEAVENGLAVLNALGIAAPGERRDPPPRLTLRLGRRLRLKDPLWERVRRLALDTGREIADALRASRRVPAEAPTENPAAAFRSAAIAAEAELVPSALLPLPTPELATTLTLVAQLGLEPDHVKGDGRLVNVLSSALGRRTRRRVRRRLEPGDARDIAGIDFAAWRAELHALARAAALDTIGGDLRAALCALVAGSAGAEAHALGPGADLSSLVAAHPEARDLLGRVVRAWIDTVK